MSLDQLATAVCIVEEIEEVERVMHREILEVTAATGDVKLTRKMLK